MAGGRGNDRIASGGSIRRAAHLRVAIALLAFVIAIAPLLSATAQSTAPTTAPGSTTSGTGSMPTTSGNLDLSSTSKSVTATSGGTIKVGATRVSINPGDLITPAQALALTQLATGGTQTLVLGALGNAVGGTFHLNGSGSLDSLVIPRGVTALGNFSAADELNLSGNLTNSGRLYLYSTDAASNVAAINAQNIYNNRGGLLSSVLPTSLLSQIGGISSLSLDLSAINNIINAGIIRSSGSITLTAGNSIINALPQGVMGAAPLVQAATNLNLNANNIVNSGVMQALAGNINIAGMTANNINFNNQNGTLKALLGQINVRDALFNTKSNFDLVGGTLLSQQLNIFSGDGIATVNAKEISGLVNVTAGEAHVSVQKGNLNLGEINLSGDPTFYNTAGNITLTSNLNFAGDALAIIAKGSVLANNGITISTADDDGPGGDITIVAGANIILGSDSAAKQTPTDGGGDTSTTVFIVGPSGTAGSIKLGNIAELTSASTNGDGGDIQLIAYGGGIQLPDDVTINASGSAGKANGNVLMIAQSTIDVGGISTAGGGTGGTISIYSAVPSITTGENGAFVSILDGVVSPTDGQFAPGKSTTGSIILGGTGATVEAGSSLLVNTRGAFTAANDITVGGALGSTGNGGTITINALSATLNGNLVANGDAASGGTGGSIAITTTSNLRFNGDISANAGTTGDFNGGQINITGGALSTTNGIVMNLSANAFGTGNGGTIKFYSTKAFKVGTTAGTLNVSATGGSSGSADGDGGIVQLRSGGDLTVLDTSGITAGPQGNNGDGANVELNAGYNTTAGRLFITGTLDVSGGGADHTGTGNGGTLSLMSTSSTVFNMAPTATGNGVTGTLSANAGNGGGNGGSIFIQNRRTGGISADASAINVNAHNGDGGSIVLVAAKATPTLSASDLDIDFTNTIPVTLGTGFISSNLAATGVVTLKGTTTLAVDGDGNGNGGTLGIVGTKITSTGGVITMNANGSGTGSGGEIYVGTTASGANISATGGPNDFAFSATSGAAGGNGGTIALKATQGNITVTPGASTLQFGAIGASGDGNGGILQLAAGDSTSTADRNVLINGTMNDLNGQATGDGGSLYVITNSSKSIELNAATTNGLTAAITANGGTTSGDGGTMVFSNYHRNKAGNAVDTSITGQFDTGQTPVSPLASGNGGTIALMNLASNNVEAKTKGVNIPILGDISMDGVGNGSGGKIILQGSLITRPSGLDLTADASGAGYSGGTIVIRETSITGAISVDNSDLSASARAGDGGAGGSLYVGSNSVTADSAAYNIGLLAGATSGINGGNLAFIAKGLLTINGQLDATVGGGDGGNITLAGANTTPLNLDFDVHGDSSSTPGSIGIQTNGDITLNSNSSETTSIRTSKAGNNFTVNSPGGLNIIGNVTAKKTISLTADTGNITTPEHTDGAPEARLTAPVVSLEATAGSIGSFDDSDIDDVHDARVLTATPLLNATAQNDVYINNNGNLTIGDVDAGDNAGDVMMISTFGKLTVPTNKTLVANDIYLRTNYLSNGSVILNGQIGNSTAGTVVRISADGKGTITQGAGTFNIKADQIFLDYESYVPDDPTQPAPNGNIGTTTSPLRIEGNGFSELTFGKLINISANAGLPSSTITMNNFFDVEGKFILTTPGNVDIRAQVATLGLGRSDININAGGNILLGAGAAVGFADSLNVLPGPPPVAVIEPGSTIRFEAGGSIQSEVGIYHENTSGDPDRGIIRGHSVTLIAHGGDVGSNVADVTAEGPKLLSVAATELTINAPNGSAYINGEDITSLSFLPLTTKSIVLQPSGGTFQLLSSRPITVSSAIAVDNVNLEIYATLVGDIILNANIGKTGVGQTEIVVDGDNSIFQNAGTILSPTVLLGGSTTGDVGTAARPIKTTADTLIIGRANPDAPTTPLDAAGKVYISNNSAGLTIYSGGSLDPVTPGTVGSVVSITNTGSITVPVDRPLEVKTASSTETAAAAQLSFNIPFTVKSASQVKVYVDGVLQTSGYTVNVSTRTVNFTTAPTTGAVVEIATTDVPTLTLKSISGDIDLNSDLSATNTHPGDTPGGVVNLTTGIGNITQINGVTITADTVNLTTTTGSIGITERISLTDASAVNVTTTGKDSSVFLATNGDVTLTKVLAKAIDVLQDSAGDLTINGTVGKTGGSVTLTNQQTGGDIFGGPKGSIIGDLINLDVADGDIGSGTQRVKVTSNSLLVHANNAFLQSTKAVNLTPGIEVAGTLDLLSASTITGSADAETIVLTATSGNIGSTLSDFQAGASTTAMTLTAANVYAEATNTAASTIGGTSKSGVFKLTLAGDTTISNLNARTTLTINGNNDANITFDSGVKATTLNVATTGTGDISSNTNITVTNLSATTVAGSVNLSTAAKVTLSNSSADSLTITSNGGMMVKGVVEGATSVSLTNNGGNMTIATNMLSAPTMTLDQTGTGSIIRSGAKSGVIADNLTISTDTGSIGSSAAYLTIAPLTTNGSITASTGAGNAYLQNSNPTGVTTFTTGVGQQINGALTLKDSSGSGLTLNEVTVGTNTASTKNNLLVIENTGNISVNDNITVNGGSLTLQAVQSTAQIALGAGVVVGTNVASTTPLTNGIVKLVVGPKIPTNNGNAVQPGAFGPDIVIQNDGVGKVIVAFNSDPTPVAYNGTVTPALLHAKGRPVILSSVNQGNIILNDGSQVVADPPVGATLATPAVHSASTTTSSPATGTNSSTPTAAATAAKPLISAANPLNLTTVPISVVTARDTMPAASQKSNVLSGGVAMSKQSANASPQLQHGGTLLAPDDDITLATPFGNLKVAAKAIVLVVLNDHGLALYNLHDEHRESVTVEAARGALDLDVGRHLFITRSSDSYEELNPLGYVAHRNLKSNDAGEGVTLHTSEFSITSAIGGNGPLSAMLRSANPDEKRIIDRLLKDAAIMMQTKASEGLYKRISRPGLSWANGGNRNAD